MEFEDYEDMFTFEEWSFQHLPSDGNDAKTFDELCEEVLRLSDACDKEVSIENESRSHLKKISSKSAEETSEVKRVHATESEITNGTSPINHLELGLDHQSKSQQDFAASEVHLVNDSISSEEKHVDNSQSSPAASQFSTEMVCEDREAQCLECKQRSKKCEEEAHPQVAVDTTPSKVSDTSYTCSSSSHDASSKAEKVEERTIEILSGKLSQNPCNNTFRKRETNVSISVDTNGDNIERHCRADEDISITNLEEIQESDKPKKRNVSGKTVSSIENSQTHHEACFDDTLKVLDILVDGNEKEWQNDTLTREDLFKKEIESEEIICVPKEKAPDPTVDNEDSKNSCCTCKTAKRNLTLDIPSELAKSFISVVNTILPHPEDTKADCGTEAGGDCLKNDNVSENQLSHSETTVQSHRSSSSKLELKTSVSPNQKEDEKSTDEFVMQANAEKPSKDITCTSLESLKVLSSKDSTLSKKEPEKTTNETSENLNDTKINVNTEKKKIQASDIISNRSNEKPKAKISSCQRNSPENKLQEKVQLVKHLKNKPESENNDIQKARSVANNSLLRKTRMANTDVDCGQILKISKGSRRNQLSSIMKSMKLRKSVTQEKNGVYPNKKSGESLRESSCNVNISCISSDNEKNESENKSAIRNSERRIITFKESTSSSKQEIKVTNIKSSSLELQNFKKISESCIDGTSPGTLRELRDDSKSKSKISPSSEKAPVSNIPKPGFVLSKTDKKEHEKVLSNALHERQKNENKEVIFFRTTDTISVVDEPITSKTDSTRQVNYREEQISTATIEIKPNKQVSKGGLTTIINVEHNRLPPTESASTNIIHKSDPSGDDQSVFITSRSQGAARIVPFPRLASTSITLGPFHSKRDKTYMIGAVNKTKMHIKEKESGSLSPRKNVSNDSDEEIIVVEPHMQSGRQPRTYERRRVRDDNTSRKVDNKSSCLGKRGADALEDVLHSEINKTSPTLSLGSQSENTTSKIIDLPDEDLLAPLPKKSKLEPKEESNRADQKCSDLMKTVSKNEVQNSEKLGSVLKKEPEKLSMPSILITQEDENSDEETTRILHRRQNQCTLTSGIYDDANVKESIMSYCKQTFCDSSPNNIFNDETIKAICASEKTEISIPPPSKTIETGKKSESVKNPRHPSMITRLEIARRKSADSVTELPCSTKKTRMDILRSQAKSLQNSISKITSQNSKTDGEKKLSTEAALISTDPKSDNRVKHTPPTQDSKTTESKKLTSSSTTDITKKGPSALGNRQEAAVPGVVRRFRRSTIPNPISVAALSSSVEQSSSVSTSGRILRRRICPPDQSAAPTPPTA